MGDAIRSSSYWIGRGEMVDLSAKELRALETAADEYVDAMEEMAFEELSAEEWKGLHLKLVVMMDDVKRRERAAQRQWGKPMSLTHFEWVKATYGSSERQAREAGEAWAERGRMQQVREAPTQLPGRITPLNEDGEPKVFAFAEQIGREQQIGRELWDVRVQNRLVALEKESKELSEGYEGLSRDVQELLSVVRTIGNRVKEVGEALSRHSEGVRH